MRQKNNKSLNVRISADLFKMLENAAEKDHRTVSSLVKKILSEGVAHREQFDSALKKFRPGCGTPN